MAGKGLISEFYQSFSGQVNKEKQRFSADDGILVNVTLIGHIGRVGSVFWTQKNADEDGLIRVHPRHLWLI